MYYIVTEDQIVEKANKEESELLFDFISKSGLEVEICTSDDIVEVPYFNEQENTLEVLYYIDTLLFGRRLLG